MHAAVIEALGQAPKFGSFREPDPQDGEVLIHVNAAGLHPIVKALAAGKHYLATSEVPLVPGVDGVGTMDDGTRVYFAFARRPWGTMCEQTVALRSRCLPIPAGLDSAVAAAIVNPGMSSLGSLQYRAGLRSGETVLILGATGVAGQLAIQMARHLGASRVIGAGRNLKSLASAAVDAVIDLSQEEGAIREAFAIEAKQGIDVAIDYLWGRPTELFLEALAGTFRPDAARPTRLVEVGESAGKAISLPGATLRSVDVRLMGSGFGSVALEQILDTIPTLLSLAANGILKMNVEAVPLSQVESAWTRQEKGRRMVFTV